MNITLNNNQVEIFLQYLFFTAWTACENTSGNGFFQNSPNSSKEGVYNAVVNSTDYPISNNTPTNIYADYVFGRMMKFGVKLKPGPNQTEINIYGSGPTLDYQKWSKKYKSYEALIKATLCLQTNDKIWCN